MITIAQLVAAGIDQDRAELFAAPLEEACRHFSIDNTHRLVLFLANIAHESSGFKRLREDLYYTKPERLQVVFGRKRFPDLGFAAQYLKNPEKLANYVYANRLGNGDESSGDGWKYRGAGLIQLTGQANFMAAEAACGRPYKSQPELVALPRDAALTAAWFWASAGCNGPADDLDHLAVRKRINGPAAEGLDRCVAWAAKFMEVA